MGLTKRTYTDNVTVITAENLNDIQDAIIALEETPAQGLTEDMKQALLQLARKVAYIDDQGQTYYDDLYDALYPPKTVVLITAVFEQGSTVIYDDTALDDLKQYLTVTAKYDDNTTAILADSAYTVSGLLEAGTSTVTVAYNGLTTTFTVNVTARPVLSSISAVYTQSGTVYDTETLDSLKDDLVVTAHYSDSSTQTVPAADYTLSGTLTVGTSTITVSYGGKTTTFNVTVEAYWTYQWDYSMGKIEEQDGWYSAPTGTNSSSITENGQKLTAAASSSQVFIRPAEGNPLRYAENNKGIIEAVVAVNLPSNVATGFKMGIGPAQNGGSGSGVAITTHNMHLCYNTSEINVDSGVSLVNGRDYTIKLVLDGISGFAYLDGELVASIPDASIVATGAGQFNFGAQNIGATSYYVLLKSIKIRNGVV